MLKHFYADVKQRGWEQFQSRMAAACFDVQKSEGRLSEVVRLLLRSSGAASQRLYGYFSEVVRLLLRSCWFEAKCAKTQCFFVFLVLAFF